MKKQFLRVKQIADQTFLRAEKTEVLTEDLVIAEKRVDTIRVSCQTTQKKISYCTVDFGSENSVEKRLKKIPQVALGASMLENGSNFSKPSVLGETLRECSYIQTKLGSEQLEYYNEVEKEVLKPLSLVLENDVHNISKFRKQLGKLVLDMDSARTRFQTAERHSLQMSSNASLNTMGKVDSLKEELEDASQKVDQCRDALATEMFSLISKEPHLAHLIVHLHKLQASYHRNALTLLEASLPILEQQIADFPQKPVYGCSLEEHLRVTNREIAFVIESCILFLLEYGILEEGLLRIAGSASKLKKLKSAFDAGIDIDMSEYVRDPHAVSGALKSYLRELPEPLLTFALYEEWIDAARVQDFDTKLQALWQVLHKMPETNFKNLQYVIKFLSKLYENVDVNKMSSQNIAIVMAPNLIWSESEDPSIYGMNMSVASLRTSIVDTLISYADWFFPDNSISSSKSSNLNESSTDINEIANDDSEVNGNNLQMNSSEDAVSSSPHLGCKVVRKPAAPPPPLQIDSEKTSMSSLYPTAELIDLSVDLENFHKPCDPQTKPKVPPLPAERLERTPSNIVRRKSNENFSNLEMCPVPKAERPALPDRPPSYSSCSLDRRHHRQLSKGDRIPEIMTRSHIERPTVPPPERPAKPPKFCSSDNLFGSCKRGSEDEDKSSQLISDVQVVSNEDATPSGKPNSPPSTHQAKLCSKTNRFDFLVNQVSDKPPERPPRTTIEHSERTIVEVCETDEVQSSAKVQCPASTENSSHLVSTVVSKSTDGERTKPPRPQPPIPAKPKFNVATENTNL